MNKRKAFTLIELMVVLTVIIVLIGLMGNGVMKSMRKAKIQTAQAQVKQILAAVNQYKSQIGFYPNKISKNFLGKGLSNSDVYSNSTKTKIVFGPFMEFRKENSDGDDLIDPWGNEYIYSKPYDTPPSTQQAGIDSVNNGFPIVYSQGESPSDKDDDIGSW